MTSGKVEATPRELLDALPPSERVNRTEQQVGIALANLRLKRRRVWVGKIRTRVYDLRGLESEETGGTERTTSGPTRTD